MSKSKREEVLKAFSWLKDKLLSGGVMALGFGGVTPVDDELCKGGVGTLEGILKALRGAFAFFRDTSQQASRSIQSISFKSLPLTTIE
jgi:hypothetical protein